VIKNSKVATSIPITREKENQQLNSPSIHDTCLENIPAFAPKRLSVTPKRSNSLLGGSLVATWKAKCSLCQHSIHLQTHPPPCFTYMIYCLKEEFEDAKEVIRIRKQKNRQHNGQTKKYK